jgi:hypothetical protein
MNIRVLKFVVIAMGLLIVSGVTILGVTIVKRIAARGETASAPSEQIALNLPDGARIVETVLDDDRLVLRVESTDGDKILIVDLASGKLVSTVDIVEQTP